MASYLQIFRILVVFILLFSVLLFFLLQFLEILNFISSSYSFTSCLLLISFLTGAFRSWSTLNQDKHPYLSSRTFPHTNKFLHRTACPTRLSQKIRVQIKSFMSNLMFVHLVCLGFGGFFFPNRTKFHHPTHFW